MFATGEEVQVLLSNFLRGTYENEALGLVSVSSQRLLPNEVTLLQKRG